jgi:tetratricopeptide (TPR) repeat protein
LNGPRWRRLPIARVTTSEHNAETFSCQWSGALLRMSFVRLFARILIASILALLAALPVQAQSAEDIYALNRQTLQLYNQGKYAEAFRIAEQAVALAEKALGPGHPDTLLCVNNLGFLYDTQGRYGEAEPLLKRALTGREKALGPEHPATLTSVNNLGYLYQAQGRYRRRPGRECGSPLGPCPCVYLCTSPRPACVALGGG